MKDESRQEYLERINRVVDYICEHLDQDVSLDTLAGVACFSEFHFHRIFRSLMGETVGEFTSRLRMERAISRMRRSNQAALNEIALECGFNSLSNFSRSFKKRYGKSPTHANMDELLKLSKIGQAYPIPSRYYLQEFPEDELDLDFPVQVSWRDHIDIAYVRCYGLYVDGQQGIDAYGRLMAWAEREGFRTPESKVIGMSPDDPEVTPLAKCRYDLCITIDRPIQPQGEIGYARVPAGCYATHHCKGDITVFERAWNYFFKVWFPASGYEPSHRPAMEIFHSRPEEVGWEYFDIDCCVPIRSLWS
jgi:DNA gyrase inhibitor GyrI/AraC-like DNA-binding protein